MFGITEWVLVALVLVLILGASRIPAIGTGVGKAIRNLIDGLKDESKHEKPKKDSK